MATLCFIKIFLDIIMSNLIVSYNTCRKIEDIHTVTFDHSNQFKILASSDSISVDLYDQQT